MLKRVSLYPILLGLMIIFNPCSLLSAFSQEGTEFWVCFERNYKDQQSTTPQNELHLQLFISGNTETKIQVDIQAIQFHKEINLKAGTLEVVDIDAAAQIKVNEQAQHLGVHIQSEKPISVYGLNNRFQTTDTYTALPLSSLGKEYRILSYTNQDDLLSQCAIVATEDHTKVTIIPTANSEKQLLANKPSLINLMKGEVFQFAAKLDYKTEKVKPDNQAHDVVITSTSENTSKKTIYRDLTGTYISADKKIAVFSGHQCGYVPSNIIACNHLVEQMLPMDCWGTLYYAGELKSRKGSIIRVITGSEHTSISVNDSLRGELNPGQIYEFEGNNQLIKIKSNKPISVAQFSKGLRSDSIGDPMMMLIRPESAFQKSYRISTPKKGMWHHYINIYASLNVINNLKLDGKQVGIEIFKQYEGTNFYFGSIEIEYGSHFLESTEAFGISSYGFGYDQDAFDAYGNM
jgi:adhesin/invasin